MKIILMLILPLFVLTSCTTFEAKRAENEEYIKDGKCTLHNVELVNEVQEIAYGLPLIPSKYTEYHYKYFPNYEPFIMGGCFYSESFPKEKSTKVCPKCKEAYLILKAEIEKE